MKRQVLLATGAVIVLLIAAAVFGLRNQTASAASTSNLQTATVQRGTLVATVAAAGNVSAPQDAALAFQTSGRVSAVNVQVGDVVKPGQVLMQLDTTDQQFALKSAQTSIATAQANLDSAKLTNSQKQNQLIVAKSALDKATATLQQAQAAYNQIASRPDVGMTSQSAALQAATLDYQSALATYQIAASNINDDSTLKQAQAQFDNAQITVQQAQNNLAKASIVAPYDGIVAAVNYNVGDIAGSTAAVSVANLANLQVDVLVSEVDVSKIKVGETAQMTLDALSGNTYNAKVLRIDPVGTVSQGVVNYAVTVGITDADSAIKPGMTANLAITVDERDNVLLVPLRAVHAQGNRKLVTVLNQGKLTTVAVTTGLANDQSVEITKGLQEGDVVVLNQTQTKTQSQGGGGRGFGGGIPFLGGL